MQAAQTQMEADAMDDWFTRRAEEGKTKWGSDCWQEKYNNPTVSEPCGLSEGSAIFKSNTCEQISWFSPRWSFSQKPDLFFFFFFSVVPQLFYLEKKHFRIPPIVNYNSDEMQNKKETMIYHRQK